VHAFLPRASTGYRIVETWDTMGMRATRSDDVVLEGAFVPDKYVARTLPAIRGKTALAVSRSMAYHPEIQHAVAEMMLAFEPIAPHLDRVAEDWSNGVDHGAAWPARIVGAKHHSVEACWRVVDLAMEVSGGAGIYRANPLKRLFRDARCGRFHPANSFLVHEIVAKTALGIGLGEQPRWG